MLLFNKKMTAVEAQNVGLVSQVFPHSTFLDDVKKQLAFLPDASKQVNNIFKLFMKIFCTA